MVGAERLDSQGTPVAGPSACRPGGAGEPGGGDRLASDVGEIGEQEECVDRGQDKSGSVGLLTHGMSALPGVVVSPARDAHDGAPLVAERRVGGEGAKSVDLLGPLGEPCLRLVNPAVADERRHGDRREQTDDGTVLQ